MFWCNYNTYVTINITYIVHCNGWNRRVLPHTCVMSHGFLCEKSPLSLLVFVPSIMGSILKLSCLTKLCGNCTGGRLPAVTHDDDLEGRFEFPDTSLDGTHDHVQVLHQTARVRFPVGDHAASANSCLPAAGVFQSETDHFGGSAQYRFLHNFLQRRHPPAAAAGLVQKSGFHELDQRLSMSSLR